MKTADSADSGVVHLADFDPGQEVQQTAGYAAFIPTPVNHEWTWDDARIHTLLEEATRALVELDAFSRIVPDCFKYRSRVGLDVALEALRDFHEQSGSMDALWTYADLCRVQSVIRPYMEAVTS